MRLAALLFACAVLAAVAVACQPTGDVRCDRNAGILLEIAEQGWTTDCTPDFPNKGTNDGGQTWFTIWAWADDGRDTVWVWPDAISTQDHLRKTLWHELAHVRGIDSEADADRYAWCREPIASVGYRFSTFPTDAECEGLGAG